MMRTYIICCICVIFIVEDDSLPAQSMFWSTPISVASSDFGFARPRVVVNGMNDPVFLWTHQASHNLYFNSYSQGIMTDPVQINPQGTNYFGATWAGPELASYGQHVYIVGKQQPENENGVSLFYSSDGGTTFSEQMNVDWGLDDDLSRFPDVAAGPDGQVWVAFMRFEPDFSDPRYMVSKSVDYGQSFGLDVNASTETIDGEACDCCAAQLAVSGDKLAMIFRNNEQNIRTIWAGVSEDGGDNFEKAFEVDLTGSFFATCPATAPDGYWADNQLISTYRAAPGGRERVYFSVFDLDSQKVVLHQYLTNSPDKLLTQNHPRISGNKDTILLIWEEAYAGNLDIKYRLSTTGPQGLVDASAQVLNLSTSGNQLRPDVHWANGRFHVVYQDVISKEVIYVEGSVDGSSGIKQGSGFIHLDLFPNPTTGLIYIPVELQITTIEVVDIAGRTVFKRHYSIPCENLDLSELQKGVYQLILSDHGNEKRYATRMVKSE